MTLSEPEQLVEVPEVKPAVSQRDKDETVSISEMFSDAIRRGLVPEEPPQGQVLQPADPPEYRPSFLDRADRASGRIQKSLSAVKDDPFRWLRRQTWRS